MFGPQKVSTQYQVSIIWNMYQYHDTILFMYQVSVSWYFFLHGININIMIQFKSIIHNTEHRIFKHLNLSKLCQFFEVGKSFRFNSWNFGHKIFTGCREIAFCPVAHFILSHPVYLVTRVSVGLWTFGVLNLRLWNVAQPHKAARVFDLLNDWTISNLQVATCNPRYFASQGRGKRYDGTSSRTGPLRPKKMKNRYERYGQNRAKIKIYIQSGWWLWAADVCSRAAFAQPGPISSISLDGFSQLM